MESRHAPAEVVEAIKDPAGTGIAPRLKYTLDGEDITRPLKKADWGWGDGGAQLLNANIGGRIPLDRAYGETIIQASVAGFEWEMFVSKSMTLEHPDRDWTTDMIAATAGGLADKINLNQDLEVLGWSPMQLLYNAYRRLPYDPALIRIAPMEVPLINRTEPDVLDPEDSSFVETQYVNDMIGAVREDMKSLLAYDTARGVRAAPDPGLGSGLPVTWNYRRNTDELISMPTPKRVDPDKEYDRVVVLDKNDDGSDRVRFEWPVTRPGGRKTAIKGRTLYLPITDTSSRANEIAGLTAKAEAAKASGGIYDGKATVLWNPFLFPGSALHFDDDYSDNAGRKHILWLLVLGMDVQHTDDARKLSTTFSYTATKLEEELVVAPTLLLSFRGTPLITTSTVKIFPPAVGRDEQGLYVVKEYTKPSRWAARDAQGLYFNTETSGGLAGRDGQGLWLLREGYKWTGWAQSDATLDKLNDYTIEELDVTWQLESP